MTRLTQMENYNMDYQTCRVQRLEFGTNGVPSDAKYVARKNSTTRKDRAMNHRELWSEKHHGHSKEKIKWKSVSQAHDSSAHESKDPTSILCVSSFSGLYTASAVNRTMSNYITNTISNFKLARRLTRNRIVPRVHTTNLELISRFSSVFLRRSFFQPTLLNSSPQCTTSPSDPPSRDPRAMQNTTKQKRSRLTLEASTPFHHP